MKTRRRAARAVAALAALLAAASGCARKAPGPGAPAVVQAPMATKWTCPMHPGVVRDRPGDCPICGMKLVPLEAPPPTPGSEGTAGPAGLVPVVLDPQKRQLLGLKTTVVTRGPFETSIRTVGRVAFDERRVHHVHTRYEAFVEHVEADFTGKYVTQGEILAHLYSPELFATEQEYLLALKASRSLGASGANGVAEGGRQLLDAARQRLLLWEVSPADIEEIARRGEPIRSMPVYAPISGYVTGRTAFHGMKVSPADTLFDIVNLSSVWVFADVYEYELPRLRLGERATMTLSYWPGRSWSGTVTYVYPSVDEKTRTVKVRLEFANPKEELKPEMFADVTILGPTRTVLRIPDDAVLDSGTRKVVFLVAGDALVPREVTLGDHGDGVYEVRSGLADGDAVALGANFLVDSESRLKAALAALTAGSPEPRPSPSAGGRTP